MVRPPADDTFIVGRIPRLCASPPSLTKPPAFYWTTRVAASFTCFPHDKLGCCLPYWLQLRWQLFTVSAVQGSNVSRYSMTDWVSFLVFNIGNSTVDSVPAGTRVIIGLLQSVSVRNAGFQVVPLAAVAPALKFVVFIFCAPAPEMNTRNQEYCTLS